MVSDPKPMQTGMDMSNLLALRKICFKMLPIIYMFCTLLI